MNLLDVVVGGAGLLFVVALLCLTHLSLFIRGPQEELARKHH